MHQLQHMFCKATADGQHLFDTSTASKSLRTRSLQYGMRSSIKLTSDLCLACDYGCRGKEHSGYEDYSSRYRPPQSWQWQVKWVAGITDRESVPGCQSWLDQGSKQCTIDWRYLLEQQTLVFLITSNLCPRQCFIKFRSICVAGASCTATVWSIPTWACAHHWPHSSCPRSFLINLCMPANEKPPAGCICSDHGTQDALDHPFSSVLWWELCKTFWQTWVCIVWMWQPPNLLWVPVNNQSSKILVGI